MRISVSIISLEKVFHGGLSSAAADDDALSVVVFFSGWFIITACVQLQL